MRTVELFAGIGGFRIAADRLGWETVWANDSSEKACIVYHDRFGPKELHQGDFTELKAVVPDHDVLTGGFPCQPFSSAGKKEGTRDARGTLFELIVDVLKMRRPKFFVLENVKRLLTMENGGHFATILGSLAELDYALEWRLLNAMHFGLPQNRERVVILGVRKTREQLDPRIRLALPEDFSTIKGRQRDRLAEPATWNTIPEHKARFPDWGLASAGRFFGLDLEKFTTACPLVRLAAVLQDTVPAEFDFTEATLKWAHENDPVNRFIHGVEILSNQRGGARMGYTIFGTNGVAPTLTSTTSRHYERYKIGERYRRLTNIEYARIQGFPDEHCKAVSVYDQYQLFGNAVPPPLVEWVLSRLSDDGITRHALPRRKEPATLFDDAN
ncbi:DNA cytosine methyltransferase [Gemmata palustris]|nr:DNA (cytosine-5-)-methyltransferase [Gemmata palustris]